MYLIINPWIYYWIHFNRIYFCPLTLTEGVYTVFTYEGVYIVFITVFTYEGVYTVFTTVFTYEGVQSIYCIYYCIYVGYTVFYV